MRTSHTLFTRSLLALVLAAVFLPPARSAELGQLKWTFATGGGVSSCPAIGGDGTVYAAAGNLYALEGATGAQKWAVALKARSVALGSNSTVYVGADDARVYALDPDTGSPRWAVAVGVGSLAVGVDGTVYVGTDDKRILALNGATGSKKWSSGMGGTVCLSPTVGADGTLYVGSTEGNPSVWQYGMVYALDGETGRTKWTYTSDWPIRSAPAVSADGTVYVSSSVSVDKDAYGKVEALDGATGVRRWARDTGGYPLGPSAIGRDGTVCIGFTGGTVFGGPGDVYAFDGVTGAKWTFGPANGLSSQAFGADGTLYVVSADGKLCALDGATGVVKWTVSGSWVSPAVGPDGTVYAWSGGHLYALQGSVVLPLRQPLRVVLRQGVPGQIAVEVNAAPIPTFGWLFNGQPIPGATRITLTNPSVTRAAEGRYTVVASNSVGRVISEPIRAVVSNVDPLSFVGLKWEGGNAGPVTLEATAQLDVTATCHSLSNYPSSTATELYVELDPADAARFYRLNASVALQFTTAGLLNGWWLTEPAGTRVRIEMVSAATAWTTWQELTTLTLPASPYLFLDLESLGAPERVYRTTVIP